MLPKLALGITLLGTISLSNLVKANTSDSSLSLHDVLDAFDLMPDLNDMSLAKLGGRSQPLAQQQNKPLSKPGDDLNCSQAFD